MPEETENLEKEIEIPNEEETEEIEVEASAEASGEHEEEIDKYSEKVQKRIDKLTYNQREAERQRDEALRVAQTLQEKVKEFETTVQDKDKAVLKQYGGRINTELEQAKTHYKKALEDGDIDAQVATQQQIAKLAVEEETINRRMKRDSQKPTNGASSNGADAPPPVDPRATAWAQKEENSWFGRDRVMTSAAFEIDKEMQEQGINPTSSDYYEQLDGRIKEAFPHKFEQEEAKAPPVQAVGRTSAGANPNTRKSRKVKLTTSQQAIAKKLGVPLEEYAKYV